MHLSQCLFYERRRCCISDVRCNWRRLHSVRYFHSLDWSWCRIKCWGKRKVKSRIIAWLFPLLRLFVLLFGPACSAFLVKVGTSRCTLTSWHWPVDTDRLTLTGWHWLIVMSPDTTSFFKTVQRSFYCFFTRFFSVFKVHKPTLTFFAQETRMFTVCIFDNVYSKNR